MELKLVEHHAISWTQFSAKRATSPLVQNQISRNVSDKQWVPLHTKEKLTHCDIMFSFQKVLHLIFFKLSLSLSQVALAVFFSRSTFKLPFLAMREKLFSFVFWDRQNFRFWITWRPILNRGEMDDGSFRWWLRSSGAIGQRAVLIWQYLLSNAEVVSSSLTWSMLFLAFCLS